MEMVSINSESEMLDFSRRIAKNSHKKMVYFLSGDLGVGKTFFARGFVKSLCGENTIVRSPSFPILQTYKSSDGVEIFHYDFYRLGEPEEIYNLDVEYAFENTIMLVEWASVAEDLLIELMPSDVELIRLDFRLGDDGNERRVFIS